jgi:hypothetical protein
MRTAHPAGHQPSTRRRHRPDVICTLDERITGWRVALGRATGSPARRRTVSVLDSGQREAGGLNPIGVSGLHSLAAKYETRHSPPTAWTRPRHSTRAAESPIVRRWCDRAESPPACGHEAQQTTRSWDEKRVLPSMFCLSSQALASNQETCGDFRRKREPKSAWASRHRCSQCHAIPSACSSCGR